MFEKYHYLSNQHNNAAKVFLAFINNQLAGFISILHFPHPKAKNIKKVHRLVVLPDFQGIGIGLRLLNEVGQIYKNEGFRYTIVTSQPSLINSLKNDSKWICSHYGRVSNGGKKAILKNSISSNRVTASFELI